MDQRKRGGEGGSVPAKPETMREERGRWVVMIVLKWHFPKCAGKREG